METIRTEADVLVIGGGLAGLAAALRANECGCRVLIVSKGKVGRSGNTIMTRNSMAAVMDPGEEGIRRHMEDTLAGGSHLNDPVLVEIMARGARDAINWLIESGVRFMLDGDGLLIKGSPGHADPRIITVDPSAAASYRTAGTAISFPLLDKVLQAEIPVRQNILVTGLTVNNGRVIGACGFDRGRARFVAVSAKTVILAGGGAGRLYSLTTNAGDITGDSYALARQAGAGLRDMEFIQFHPAVSVEPPRMVFSTAPLADGAVLINKLGEDFMTRYSARGSMATRDVMARAICTEINQGRGGGHGGVFIDFGGIPADKMAAKYRDVLDYLRGRDMVEVAPAAHFTMGGVVIDAHCRTTVPGLYACGEAVGGVHGANRLAGNGLTEAVVFGLLAGEKAAREARESSLPSRDPHQLPVPGEVPPGGFAAAPAGQKTVFDELARELRETMTRHVGLVRLKKGLQEAGSRLNELERRLEAAEIKSYRHLIGSHQFRLMLVTAEAIVEAALRRGKSLGAHFMAD